MKRFFTLLLVLCMLTCCTAAHAISFDQLEDILSQNMDTQPAFPLTRLKAEKYEGYIAAGINVTVGVGQNGQMFAAGSDRKEIESWQGITRVRNSLNALIGFRSDGTLAFIGNGLWGFDAQSELNAVMAQGSIADAACGGYHTAAVLQDGRAVTRSSRSYSLSEKNSLNGAVKLTASSNGITAGVMEDGKVVVIGASANLSTRYNASDWTDIVDAEFSNMTLIGLKSDGSIIRTTFATEDDPELDAACSWTNIVAISANEHVLIGLKADGTAVTTGEAAPDVSGWRNIVAVAAGRSHVVGLKDDGTVVAVGAEDASCCEVGAWKLW